MKIWGSICAKNESTALCFVLYICLCLQSLLLVQVNQYMLACMLSVDVALICRPACFLCCFYCRPYWRFLLSCCSVLLTVVLFCHLNGHLILSSFSVRPNCRLILSSCSVVLTVIVFCRLVLSSNCHLILCLVCRLYCHLILSSYSVVLFCRLVLSS